LIIQLVCGAAGGNIAGALMKKYNLGTLGNSIAGIVGGFGGGQLLGMIGANAAGGGLDVGSIIKSVVGGGVGGGVLMAIIGLIKGATKKPS
jgi:uncharacterized membrane protein YeaQ/YmgE (transglycosylase-associated protein family)